MFITIDFKSNEPLVLPVWDENAALRNPVSE